MDRSDGIIIGCSSEQQLKVYEPTPKESPVHADSFQDNIRDLEKGPLPDAVVQAMDEAWPVAKSNCPKLVICRGGRIHSLQFYLFPT